MVALAGAGAVRRNAPRAIAGSPIENPNNILRMVRLSFRVCSILFAKVAHLEIYVANFEHKK